MLLRIGETIDRYRIEALIGQGGMAAVYRVRHVQLDSEHALKVLFITAPKVINRLLREGRVQANLRHPNIVSVTDVLNIQGAPALLMEYIDGPALDTWLLENRPTLEESLWLFRGILRGMSAAHERGVVHRDLKPANVLLAPTEDGLVPKVTDFGLVKSVVEQRGDTQTGMTMGTPEYMSPEQIRDASDIDIRADMWSLGCILYELVCHRRAFQGVDKMSTFNQIVAGTYEPPRKLVENLPRNVAEAIRSLLEVDRDKRLSRCEPLHDLLYEEQAAPVGRIASPTKSIVPLRVEPPSAESVAPLSQPLPLQLSVPTGAPATQRVSTPRRGVRPTLEPDPPRKRTSVRRVVFGALAAVLASVAVIATLTIARSTTAAEAPPRGTGPPSLVRTVRPSPLASRPVVIAFPPPSWEEPDDEGEPATRASPEASPRSPAGSASAAPSPAEAAAPLPASRTELMQRPGDGGRVSVTGDARQVWLEAGGKRIDPDGLIAPGSYLVVADFGSGSPVGAGRIEIEDGAEVTLSCTSSLAECRSQ
ncbi:MAG: serine/threonine-protein kinase [Myxococcota bacterium]